MRDSKITVVICAWLILCMGARLRAKAQDMSSQKVGGTSSFETSPGLSGNDSATARKSISSVGFVPEDFSKLPLAAGFLLSMDVYDAPEWSKDLRVDQNGDIAVAIIGRMHVAGETATQAGEEIAARLREKKILNNPQVTLNIEQYAIQSATVLGEVHSPGKIELLAPHSLADLIALCGGETQYAGSTVEIHHADGSKVEIARSEHAPTSGDPALLSTMVHPGDTVIVTRAGVVYVLGGVTRPGGYVMQEGGRLDVTQALSLAYGTTMQAAVDSMWLVRKMPDGSLKQFPLHYREIMKGKAIAPPLQAEDVLYVPISKVKTVLGAGLLASAATAAIYVH